MTNFVSDNTTLPFPKTDARALPVGTDPTQAIVAADWNKVCQATIDVRGAILRGSLSAADFGALPDFNPTTGAGTDNRAAFTTAIAAAVAAGNDLLIPPGHYRLSKYVPVIGAIKIKIHASAFVSIYYGSDDLSLIPDTVATTYAQVRSAFYLLNCQDVSFENIEFVGGDSTDLTWRNVGPALYVARSVGTRISNCRARGGATLYQQDARPGSSYNLTNVIAVTSGIVTLTNPGDTNGQFHPGMVGRLVTITGATNPSNNGVFTILSYVSSTQITYANVGVNESSSFGWSVNDGDDDTRLFACRLDGCRSASYTGSGGSFTDCTFVRPMTHDRTGVPDSFRLVGTTVTLVDATAPWAPGHAGSYVKIQGSTSGGNDGLFLVLAATAGTTTVPATLTYTNASGVSELASRKTTVWLLFGGERSGLGAGATAIASSSGVVTFTAASSIFRANDVGKILRRVDCTTAANNGASVITRYISATQVQYVQTGAVSETFAGMFSVDGYDNAKGDQAIGPTITSTSTSVAANSLTDSALTMVTNAYANRVLADSLGRQWLIVSNTATVFTVSASGATPTAGAYFVPAGGTYGSSHGIYYFAGRSRVRVTGCDFRGIRTIGVKVSGSVLPIDDVEIGGCTFDECGSAAILGADDSQDHNNINIHDNVLINCGIGRIGWCEQWGIGLLGARNVKIRSNELIATHDAIASLVNGGALGGFYGIFAGRYVAGISQPLEDVMIDSNTFTGEPNSSVASRVGIAAIHLERIGQRAYWRTGGTLTKQVTGALSLVVVASAGTITRATGSWITDGYYVGGQVSMTGFVNGGNNVVKTLSVVTALTLTVTSTTGLVNETHSASATNGMMTLADSGAAFSQALTGASIQLVFAPDSANNNARALETRITDWTVNAVTGTSSLNFVNIAGVGGGVSAGTYRINPKASVTASRGGSCQVVRNNISGYGSIGIETLACTAPQIVGNIFNGLATAINEKSSVAPHISQSVELLAASNGARIQLTTSTAWPIIYDNWITNGALKGGMLLSEETATRSEMGIGVDASGTVDHPLLGRRGRVPAGDGKPNIVFPFGGELVDGDQIAVVGTIYTYKRSSPAFASKQFNGMVYGAGSNLNEYGETITQGLIDGDGGANWNGITASGFTAEDYAVGLTGSPNTGHVRFRTTAASASANLGYIDTINVLNPTALVILRTDTAGGESIAYTRAEASAGPIADKTVLWSPCMTLTGGVQLWADSDSARTLLAAGSPATGLVTCVAKASYQAANADTMTISDGVQATKAYYFDTSGVGGGTGIQVNISTDTSAAQVAARLRTAVLANQPALAVADNTDGTLTVTHLWPGAGGNVAITEAVSNAGHTVRGLTNGAAGGYRALKASADGGACEVLTHAKSTDDAGASLGARFRWSLG